MVLDDQKKLYGRTKKAIEETIRICEEQDILVEYLKSRKVEVQNIMYTLFDQERINELNRLDAAEKAAEKTTEKINALNKLLIATKRFVDLEKAANDVEFQNKLIKELLPV